MDLTTFDEEVLLLDLDGPPKCSVVVFKSKHLSHPAAKENVRWAFFAAPHVIHGKGPKPIGELPEFSMVSVAPRPMMESLRHYEHVLREAAVEGINRYINGAVRITDLPGSRIAVALQSQIGRFIAPVSGLDTPRYLERVIDFDWKRCVILAVKYWINDDPIVRTLSHWRT